MECHASTSLYSLPCTYLGTLSSVAPPATIINEHFVVKTLGIGWIRCSVINLSSSIHLIVFFIFTLDPACCLRHAVSPSATPSHLTSSDHSKSLLFCTLLCTASSWREPSYLLMTERIFLFADDAISRIPLPRRGRPVPHFRLFDRRFAAILQPPLRRDHVLWHRVTDDIPFSYLRQQHYALHRRAP